MGVKGFWVSEVLWSNEDFSKIDRGGHFKIKVLFLEDQGEILKVEVFFYAQGDF